MRAAVSVASAALYSRADEHLATAAAMFREMGMASWLSQAETERGSLGGDVPRT